MEFKVDDYVKVVGTDGNYRYGYVSEVNEDGFIIAVCLYDEGESKLAYDAACGGPTPAEYDNLLTDAERRIIPLLADGLKPGAIGTQLETSPVTIRAQMRTLRYKFALDNNAQLVAFAQGLKVFYEKREEIYNAKRALNKTQTE